MPARLQSLHALLGSNDESSQRKDEGKMRQYATRSSTRQQKERLLHEVCDDAGMKAYASAVPRDANPYLRPVVYPIVNLLEQEKMDARAYHWWLGWDSARAIDANRVDGPRPT
ncbi:MAG: hypothetical protein ABIN44_11600 [Burkholderiaceae bacterium]